MKRRCKFCWLHKVAGQTKAGHLMDDLGNPIEGDPRGMATDGICLRAYPLVVKDMESAIAKIKPLSREN